MDRNYSSKWFLLLQLLAPSCFFLVNLYKPSDQTSLWQNRPKMRLNPLFAERYKISMVFSSKATQKHYSGEKWQNIFSYFFNFRKYVQSKESSKMRKCDKSGVNVMITIFCDFRKKIGEKIGIYLKKCKYHFLHNLSLFWAKNAYCFADFFGENILKIITSVPGQPDTNTGKKLALQIALST
jgi:hypothetical protein